jgi:hypothetical protein
MLSSPFTVELQLVVHPMGEVVRLLQFTAIALIESRGDGNHPGDGTSFHP